MKTKNWYGKQMEVADFTREKQESADVQVQVVNVSGNIHGNRKVPGFRNRI